MIMFCDHLHIHYVNTYSHRLMMSNMVGTVSPEKEVGFALILKCLFEISSPNLSR